MFDRLKKTFDTWVDNIDDKLQPIREQLGINPIFGKYASAGSDSTGYVADAEWQANQAEIARDWQTRANQAAMDFSAEQTAIQRAYETEMSNTAYQRAMADMKKAGLNPILAYAQGGASVPSVTAASGVTSSGYMPSVSSAESLTSAEKRQTQQNIASLLSAIISTAAIVAKVAK